MSVNLSNGLIEWHFKSSANYSDPYNDIDIDGIVQLPDNREIKVPGFWSGGNRFTIRIKMESQGSYSVRTTCTNQDDKGLHDQVEELTVNVDQSTQSATPGRLQVSANRRFFEYENGEPFFWLGDTWWMALCKRIDWPVGFDTLADDRVKKGFNIIHLVTGPYPDMTAFDTRGEGEDGFPFEPDFDRVRPEYFIHADQRIIRLIEKGLHPFIVSMWGYYLLEFGLEKTKRFWRYLIGRYASLPVVWCAAGEVAMPFYLSKTPEDDSREQMEGWTEVIRFIQQIDPYDNPITAHPTNAARDQVTDQSVIDYDMLQTGHDGYGSIPSTVRGVRDSYTRKPTMPSIVGETNYEGILGGSHQDVQRRQFWYSVLSGAAGFTYGANGIWQANTIESPYGLSPHGRGWGDTPWREAAQLPGSTQVGFAAQFLRSIPWHELAPASGLVSDEWSEDNLDGNMAAVGPDGHRLIYVASLWNPPEILDLSPGESYSARYFNPVLGTQTDLGRNAANEFGVWTPPIPPHAHDWVIYIEP